MIQKNKAPNLDAAHQVYGTPNFEHGTEYLPWPGKSLEYSCAYVMTNEDLRHTTGLTRDMARKVLTVAGSGDQPLFYTLNGATHVDTFDVSFCARAIMDLKTQAIRSGISHDHYINLLSRLHVASSVSRIPDVDKMLSKIPAHSAKFIRGMDGYRIFGNGIYPDYYTAEMLTAPEYKQLQLILKKPFKFIWSDLSELHTHLTDEYDVINLSNIFEWTPGLIKPALTNLRPHVRPGGYILAQTGGDFTISKNINHFIRAQELFKDWAKIGINKTNRDNQVIILERVR